MAGKEAPDGEGGSVSGVEETTIERLSKIDWDERLANDALTLYLRAQFDRETALVRSGSSEPTD